MLKLPKLTLVTGGAASGKSAFAEGLITGSRCARVYLATAQIWDAEMAAKVADHQIARGPDWRTVDAGADLGAAMAGVAPGEAVLLDCLTMWLTRITMEEADMDVALEAMLAALAACPAPLVVVTNELGQGVVPEGAMTRRFRNAHGRMNQRVAAQADRVVAVMAGLPLVLKGET